MLMTLLAEECMLAHRFVIGEISLGSLRGRDFVFGALLDLPRSPVATPSTFYLIERAGLFNRGIGYVDTSLLVSARLQPGITVWTRDKRLKKVADERHFGAILAHQVTENRHDRHRKRRLPVAGDPGLSISPPNAD